MSNNGHFHITVTENQTGRVIKDVDTDCLIGAYHFGEQNGCDEVRALNASYCNLKTMLETLAGVQSVFEAIIASDTNLQRFRPLIDKAKASASTTKVDASALLTRDD